MLAPKPDVVILRTLEKLVTSGDLAPHESIIVDLENTPVSPKTDMLPVKLPGAKILGYISFCNNLKGGRFQVSFISGGDFDSKGIGEC